MLPLEANVVDSQIKAIDSWMKLEGFYNNSQVDKCHSYTKHIV